MLVKLDVTVMYQSEVSVCLWQFDIKYASNSIFSGVTLRDYICLLVRITGYAIILFPMF